MSTRCKALIVTTKKRCKRVPVDGSLFCNQHHQQLLKLLQKEKLRKTNTPVFVQYGKSRNSRKRSPSKDSTLLELRIESLDKSLISIAEASKVIADALRKQELRQLLYFNTPINIGGGRGNGGNASNNEESGRPNFIPPPPPPPPPPGSLIEERAKPGEKTKRVINPAVDAKVNLLAELSKKLKGGVKFLRKTQPPPSTPPTTQT